MNKPNNKRNKNIVLLKGTFNKNEKENLITEFGVITEYLENNEAFVFLGDREKFNTTSLKNVATKIVTTSKRSYEIDLDSFITNNIDINTIATYFAESISYNTEKIWNKKTQKNESKANKFELLTTKKIDDNEWNKSQILINAIKMTRDLQIMSPNELNSENMAKLVEENAKPFLNDKFSIKILNKKEIEKEKMGLLLSVNKGSMYEPRVVVLEYKGDPNSDKKIVYVGKGITFDSGGYSLKPSRYMIGMKFDMSGAAIVASSLISIAQLQPKSNVAAVLCITDNRINGDASLPDSVWTSMNGKTVEVNNTDAEGRLVMADGITYAIRKLKATRVVDVATLTGAILTALGTTYTGIWATTENAWNDISMAALNSNELVWRMPLNDEFAKNIKKSEVADLKNTDFSGNGGSCSAAMFLKEFTEDVEYIHCDIAGTSEQNGIPTGVMVKTLTELAL
ncbi:M17 family metallopeptidase [Mycoplasma elephantis]|uniref:M17 family metallopeptidase n=1 Tax=Mycoplasma elephantis TaxID=114882 RepID=UPI0004821D00|nr:M17 family metallopeptidase [Mycoplasma elephantis]